MNKYFFLIGVLCSLQQKCSTLKLAHLHFPESEMFAQEEQLGSFCSPNATALQLYDCTDSMAPRPIKFYGNSLGPNQMMEMHSLADFYGYTMLGFEHAISRSRAFCPAARKIHLLGDDSEVGQPSNNAGPLFLQFGVGPSNDTHEAKRKIVYQSEQMTSGFLRDRKYLETLKQAKQVWTWGKDLARKQSTFLGREVLHVPMELAMKTDVHPSPDDLEEGNVLFFGIMNARRIAVCNSIADALMNESHKKFTCKSLWGDALAREIDKASVVFVTHFYEQADLEVHRINELMAKGKVIVAEIGPDEELNQKYRDAGVQVVAKADISNTVVKLTRDPELRSALRKKVTRSIQMFQESSLNNLCLALDKLVQDSQGD